MLDKATQVLPARPEAWLFPGYQTSWHGRAGCAVLPSVVFAELAYRSNPNTFLPSEDVSPQRPMHSTVYHLVTADFRSGPRDIQKDLQRPQAGGDALHGGIRAQGAEELHADSWGRQRRGLSLRPDCWRSAVREDTRSDFAQGNSKTALDLCGGVTRSHSHPVGAGLRLVFNSSSQVMGLNVYATTPG